MGFASAALWKFFPKDRKIEDRRSTQIGWGERAKSTAHGSTACGMKLCSLRSQTNIWIPNGLGIQVYSFLSLLCQQGFPAGTYPGQGITCYMEMDMLVGYREHMLMSLLALKWTMISISLFSMAEKLNFSLSSLPSMKFFGGLLLTLRCLQNQSNSPILPAFGFLLST